VSTAEFRGVEEFSNPVLDRHDTLNPPQFLSAMTVRLAQGVELFLMVLIERKQPVAGEASGF
jgi:hypothetical protein